MLKLTKELGSSVQATVGDWLSLNKNELIWIALIVGGVLFGANFMNP